MSWASVAVWAGAGAAAAMISTAVNAETVNGFMTALPGIDLAETLRDRAGFENRGPQPDF
jgi:hypothetical protein